MEILEQKARAEPVKAAGLAFVAGYILSRLPVRAILFVAIRVALSLVRPALLILGGAKAWDLIQARCGEKSHAIPETRF